MGMVLRAEQMDMVEDPVRLPQVVTLSRRAYEVALLLASTMTPAEIAAQLFISEQTVKNHLSAIYARVGITGKPGSNMRAYVTWLYLTGRIVFRPADRRLRRAPNRYSRLDFAALVDLEEEPQFEKRRLMAAFEAYLDGRLG